MPQPGTAMTDDELDDLGGQAPVEETKPRKSQADMLVELTSDLEVFHQDIDEAYASITVGTHIETWPIRSQGFRRWLSREHWTAHHKAPGSQAIQDALNVIAGRAIHDGPQIPVHIRLAETDDGIFLDLADEQWRAAKMTPTGWDIVTDVPVKFRRTRGTLSIPEPKRGSQLDELREFINLPDDESQWSLFKAFLISALRPRNSQPILILSGEQGSAKTTASRKCTSLIDPKKAAVRGLPRDPRDLMIAAANGWLMAFDNVSKIPGWLSDALCSLSTGGGYSTRELYSDGDEKIFDAMRPVIVNGITDIATRPDILDRALILDFPAISDERRLEEQDIEARFEEARPRILGALLDSVVRALRDQTTIEMVTRPRMADFARWACAAESAHSQEKIFLAAYTANRSGVNDVAIEASVIGLPILALMEKQDRWTGTVGELLTELTTSVGETTSKTKEWPKTARGLSSELTRVSPNLRRRGLEIKSGGKRNKGRLVTLERRGKRPSQPSQNSANSPPDFNESDGRDANDGHLRTHSSEIDEIGVSVGKGEL